jgi:hypothetical protein
MEFRKFLPWIVLVLGVLVVFSACGSYNTAVGKDEAVKKSWSQVENQYRFAKTAGGYGKPHLR